MPTDVAQWREIAAYVVAAFFVVLALRYCGYPR